MYFGHMISSPRVHFEGGYFYPPWSEDGNLNDKFQVKDLLEITQIVNEFQCRLSDPQTCVLSLDHATSL